MIIMSCNIHVITAKLHLIVTDDLQSVITEGSLAAIIISLARATLGVATNEQTFGICVCGLVLRLKKKLRNVPIKANIGISRV
jgi:hypothetical protein